MIRLGPMFGGSRKKDMLHDILTNREVFINEETRYAYVDVAWVGKQIVNMLENEIGIQEIGARNWVRLRHLASYFGSTSKFSGIVEDQIPKDFKDGPDSSGVFVYAQREKDNATD